MSGWNAQYRRWSGKSVGVWTRRLSIARYGLRLSLSGKIIKVFLFLGLFQAFFMAAVFFLFGQLVAPDSYLLGLIAKLLDSFGAENAVQLINGLTSWALLYPEICVDGVYRIMFFLMWYTAPWLSLVTVSLFVHKLIANDLASQAIVIYNSKALTRWDYLIGKFAIVATILSVIWIAPVLISWMLGNLLSPDWSFFWHSIPSLVRALSVGVVAVVVLSVVALAISSMAKKTGTAVAYWMLGWVGMFFVTAIVRTVHPVFAYFNPLMALSDLHSGVFNLKNLFHEASGMLPFFDRLFGSFSNDGFDDLPIDSGAIILPLFVLSLVCGLCVFLVNRRVSDS